MFIKEGVGNENISLNRSEQLQFEEREHSQVLTLSWLDFQMLSRCYVLPFGTTEEARLAVNDIRTLPSFRV